MIIPEIIPAIQPYLLVLFQNRDINIAGPNTAPKPAHAKDTILNTELEGSQAIITPNTPTITSVSVAHLNLEYILDYIFGNSR